MQLSKEGLDFLVLNEGLRLRPYLDSKGVPTIGIGSTFYENGTKVKMTDKKISVARAYELAGKVLEDFTKSIAKEIKVELKQNQVDALISFTYNIGVGAFKRSTCLRKLNNKDYKGAADAMLLFNKVNGVINKGLVNRRDRERKLFLGE